MLFLKQLNYSQITSNYNTDDIMPLWHTHVCICGGYRPHNVAYVQLKNCSKFSIRIVNIIFIPVIILKDVFPTFTHLLNGCIPLGLSMSVV